MIEYDPKKWTSHLLDLRGSMFHAIIGRVLACVGWSTVVLLAHRWLVYTLKWDHDSIPSTVHSLVGVALGLLLVFRTNTSYDRFWEGRKLWGSIVNESRNLARACTVFLKDDPALARTCVRWTIAWAYAAKGSLRGKPSLGPVARSLPPEEVKAALAAGHVPLHVSTKITALLAEARDRGMISDFVLMSIDANNQQLLDYLGGCERIKKTPLPFAYMVHIRRALVFYCFTLPFALVETYGWGAIVGTLLVAYIFFGIEEIGVEIENPFDGDDNDLPLSRICETIEHNLLEMIGDEASKGEVKVSEPLGISGAVVHP